MEFTYDRLEKEYDEHGNLFFLCGIMIQKIENWTTYNLSAWLLKKGRYRGREIKVVCTLQKF